MSDCLSMSPAVPRWLWWAPGACVVEALRTGHFPDTLMVKLPDDRTIEVLRSDLRTLNEIRAKELENAAIS